MPQLTKEVLQDYGIYVVEYARESGLPLTDAMICAAHSYLLHAAWPDDMPVCEIAPELLTAR